MRQVTLDDFKRFVGGQVKSVDHGPPAIKNNVRQGLLVEVNASHEAPLRLQWMARFNEDELLWEPTSPTMAFSPEFNVIEERDDGCLVLRIRNTYLNEDLFLLPEGHPDCLTAVMSFLGNAPQNSHVKTE